MDNMDMDRMKDMQWYLNGLNRRDTCHVYRVLCVVVLLVSFRAGKMKMNHIWFGSEECLPAEV